MICGSGIGYRTVFHLNHVRYLSNFLNSNFLWLTFFSYSLFFTYLSLYSTLNNKLKKL